MLIDCVAVFAVFAALSCGGSGDAPPSPPVPDPRPVIASVVITTSRDTIAALGDTLTLSAQVRDATGAVVPAEIVWSSSDAGVVGVSGGSGTSASAIGVANGTSTITARASTVSAARTIVVSQRAAVLAITAASNDTLFSVGDTRTFSASVRDARGAAMSAAGVQWSIDKSAVASLGVSAGPSTIATVQGSGSAAIVARSGTVESTAALNARQRIARLAVTPTAISLGVGQTSQLGATALDSRGNSVAGAGAPDYASSDSSTVRVSAAGVVTALAAGTATIAVSQQSTDGVVRASVPVTIGASFPSSAQVFVENFAFNPTAIDIAAGGTVRWIFSNEALHNVTSAGNGPLHSANIVSGSLSFTFPTAGRFDYLCSIHPFMTGTVVVH